jgi:hypothetical protein
MIKDKFLPCVCMWMCEFKYVYAYVSVNQSSLNWWILSDSLMSCQVVITEKLQECYIVW